MLMDAYFVYRTCKFSVHLYCDVSMNFVNLAACTYLFCELGSMHVTMCVVYMSTSVDICIFGYFCNFYMLCYIFYIYAELCVRIWHPVIGEVLSKFRFFQI